MSGAPETHPGESDPNADSEHGLAGGMGVSSERTGTVRGGEEEVTYTAAPTHTDPAEDGAPTGEDAPPEQSADDGRPEVNPDPVPSHPLNPEGNPGHSGG